MYEGMYVGVSGFVHVYVGVTVTSLCFHSAHN